MSSAPESRQPGWLAALSVYADRRLLLILGMGFSSGLPLPLTTGTLAYWLAKLDVDKTEIGLLTLVGLPYSLKFLWAPVLDHVELGRFTRALGRRRSWALLAQLGLAVAIVALGQTDPINLAWTTALCALALAFFSASQDIAIDAYRIEILAEREQAAGAAATQLGYRLGMLAGGAGAVAGSDFTSWPWIFAGLATLTGVGAAAVLLAPEPRRIEPVAVDRGGLDAALLEPLREFVKRDQWLALLGFALLYKVGDAISGAMSNPFYADLGFSGVEIASISKVLGLVATLAGVVTGGVIVARLGLFPALLVGGVLQALTNLIFVWLAQAGHDLTLLAVAICADNWTGGIGTAAFVAYLSSLCRADLAATQYALLSSLTGFGRTLLSSASGWLADRLDWASFFAVTALLAAPGLLLLLPLMRATVATPKREGFTAR